MERRDEDKKMRDESLGKGDGSDGEGYRGMGTRAAR